MSGPLKLYRTTVNLRGLGVGALIEIDPTDPGWAGDIASRRIVPVLRALQQEAGGFPDFPTDDGPGPTEWVEDWDTGAIVDLSTNGEGEDGARWPISDKDLFVPSSEEPK